MTESAPSLPFVHEAAKRVAETWANDGSDVDEAGIARELDTLVGLLERGEAGANKEFLSAPPHGFLRRRLLERMRGETVRIWTQQPATVSPKSMLQVMRAFERTRAFLDPRTDPDLSRPNAPNGLELLEVAHDFRSPLTSIMYLAETLRRGQGGELNDLQRRQLGIIYNAALTLISTASDVIELTSAGEHLVDSEPTAFSVAETLESVCSVVQPIAEEKGLQIRVTPPQHPLRVGNAVALSRVLLNLTTNALKFTDEGGVDIVVVERGDSSVEFTVRDTGIGIPDDILATLYQPFRRTAARASGYYFSGSGLGLAICRKLVKAMGSELQVETQKNRGTRFFFELELRPAPRKES